MIQYSRVTEEYAKAAIVGTGSSMEDVYLTFPKDVAVIAVNAAIHYQKDRNFWFTLDPSEANREIMKSKFAGVTYYAAVPPEFRPVSDHIKYLHRVVGTGHGRYRTKAGLCPDKRGIHTGNSAWGAYQLAVHMGAKKIALFGIDGHGPYHYGGEPGELGMIPELFASSIPEIEARNIAVVNASMSSTVTCFQKMNPMEAYRWLMK